MYKTTLTIEGMVCAMCANHINDTIRKYFEIKKVNTNHHTGKTEIISNTKLEKEEVVEAIKHIGYSVIDYQEAVYVKKGLFG